MKLRICKTSSRSFSQHIIFDMLLYFMTTVHKDVTERLLRINPSLAAQARKILDINKSERHIRGGLATKDKYMHERVMREMAH